MKSRFAAVSVASALAAIIAVLSMGPNAFASRARAPKHVKVQSSFAAKDKEIASLKHQVALLQANIISLNQKIDELQRPAPAPAPAAAAASSGQRLVASDVTAQRYQGANVFGDSMWLFKMTLTNDTGIAVDSPTMQAKFSDGSVEGLLPYGGTDGYSIVVANPAIIKSLAVRRLLYFYSSHSMGLKTPVSVILSTGGSQITLPVIAAAPKLVTSH